MTRTNRVTAPWWLLLAAVIVGVIAMHILSAAADSGGSHQPMAMTSTGTALPATSPGAGGSMVMDLNTTAHSAGTQLGADSMDLSPMSCCVLFFVSAAVGLVLLIRFYTARTAGAADRARGGAVASTLQRGPPGPGRPRIALSVLRV